MREKLFYRPEDGWVGDFIPYCENDTFHLFHLKTIQPDVPFEDVGWHCVRTDDFVHFSPSDDLDIHGGTGSVVKQGDLRGGGARVDDQYPVDPLFHTHTPMVLMRPL